MSLKSSKRTAARIIAMVESGDYDPDVIEHMLASLVVSRDSRIRHLERKSKPKEFVMTPKIISGALRNCIKEHGPITTDWIGSAAKRIHGNCQRVVEKC